jgi:hypothetical protein
VTFTALRGFYLGSVKFLGVTSLWINGSGSLALPSQSSDGGKELLLVFERASEGTLLDFVERQLQGTTGEESWIVVLDTLSPIARGLANLHDHGIIHG